MDKLIGVQGVLLMVAYTTCAHPVFRGCILWEEKLQL